MDEYQNELSPEREFNMPDPSAELSLPSMESEFTLPQREAVPPESEKKHPSKVRKLIRYAAVTAAAVGILAVAESAPEPQEIESNIRIEWAAINPVEPDILKFEYSFTAGHPTGYKEQERRFYYVDADRKEHELSVEADPLLYRSCMTPHQESGRSLTPEEGEAMAYRMIYFGENDAEYQSSGWMTVGNLSAEVYRAKIPSFREGASLKIVRVFTGDGEPLKMVSQVPIVLLPPERGSSTDVRVLSVDSRRTAVHFRAVIHTAEENDHAYDFRAEDSWFCTRWYDADHRFLGSGWFFAAPLSVASPADSWSAQLIPKREGGDIVFEYSGPVHSESPDPSAAYFSLELSVLDSSTGWHYLFESEQMPVTG